MIGRTHPYISVSVGGSAVGAGFYSRLSKATITDATGQDSDRIELVFDDAGNAIAAPPEGALISVEFGYRDVGLWRMGLYTVEQISFEGGEKGETLTLTGRSADMRSDLKEPLSEHFDDDTVGGIVEKLAARHGLQAKVSGDLAGRKVPYIARLDQSTMDFGTRLADRNGALFSVKGGKMLLLKRGEVDMGSLTIARSQCASWSFETDPRPRYGQTETRWFDRETGEHRFEKASTGLKGPQKRLRHVLSSEDEAQRAASAEAERMNRATGSGSIELAGMPEAAAEMDVTLVGFRPEINGLWRAKTVTHEIGDSYMTSIELEAPESGKQPK